MVIKIKRDPLSISISLIYNLNLLEEDEEYNINELKFITDLENHWITIQKYLKIFNLIQKYCPKIELDGSKLRIIKSEIYRRLTEKEKLILYLFNNRALNSDNTIKLPETIDISLISESINYLFKKTDDNKFYLTKTGLEFYKYYKKDLSDLIYNNKDIDEIFEKTEESSKGEAGFTLIQYPSEEVHQYSVDVTVAFFSNIETSVPLSISGMDLLERDDSSSSKLGLAQLNKYIIR